jgi:GAF domain-containing protein
MNLENASFEGKHNTLLPQYMNMLMECHQASPGQLPMHHMTGSEAEFLKRQPIVLEELAAILTGSEDFRKLRDTIDTADAKCRVDMVNVLARQLKLVGKLVHAMYSVKELSTLPMDPCVCCDLFVEDVKKHVACNIVRLWLVDEKNSYIWEHDPSQENPVKRRFVVSKGTAMSSDPENMAMQALEHNPDSDQPLELNTFVLCEPVRYKGAVVAVIQCFLDDDQEDARFTQVDQLQLSFICQMAGVIFHRMFLFQDSMWSVERTLRMFALTSHYPCTARELFALTTIQLRPAQKILGASLCLVYLTAGHGLKEGRMWTRRVDGIDTTVEVAYGAGIAGWVAEEEAPVVSNDVENDKRFDVVLDTAYAAGLSAKMRTFLVSSLLAVPMKRHDGTLFGVCTMINKQGEGSPFNRADLRLLELHCELAMLSFKDTLAEDSKLTPYETIPEALRRIKMLLRVEWSLYFQLVTC